MKLTKTKLKQIIKEEKEKMIGEAGPPGRYRQEWPGFGPSSEECEKIRADWEWWNNRRPNDGPIGMAAILVEKHPDCFREEEPPGVAPGSEKYQGPGALVAHHGVKGFYEGTKLTQRKLKQIVKEELDSLLNEKEEEKWIQGAEEDIEKRGTEGVCTGDKFGGPTCRPGTKRYNLAKTFRKMAKDKKD